MLPKPLRLAGLAMSIGLLALALALPAQAPMGRSLKGAGPEASLPVLTVPALDRPTLAIDDDARDAQGLPPRFAVPNPVDVTPASHGAWERTDATWSLWRLRILAPDASHVNLGFDRFQLPAGAHLQVYARHTGHSQRPFTAADHSPTGELWTAVVLDQEVVLEIRCRTTDVAQLDVRLHRVNSGYRFFGAGQSAVQRPAAGPCNIDVICSQGDLWRSEIPAIAAYSTGGSVFCTGFMVNNTAQDGRDFFMTAYHCGIRANNAGSMVVYWNYERSRCGGPDDGSFSQFNTGATLRAGWSTSDFTLVELNQAPNPAWGVTYVGWNRGAGNASSAIAIHHPSGDEKKISFENQATQVTSYGGNSSPGDGTHVRVVDWDLGTTEPGSSGSPLFDQNHRVIGQLHGGGAACGNNQSDWYGAFSVSWAGGGSNSSRLSNWLDPLGTGQQTLDTLGGQGRATATQYGTACIEGLASFLESFSTGTFDLSGNGVTPRGLRMTPNAAGGYDVTTGGGNWRAPTSADRNLADDDVSNFTLPFIFSFPGGSTNRIGMCSNGFIWLDGTTTNDDYTPSAGELVLEQPRLAVCWTDLNPSSGGSCHIDSLGTSVVVTWLNLPEYPNAGANSLQCEIHGSGVVEYRWLSVSNTQDTAVVGFSPGNAARQPAGIDLSNALPLSTSPDANGLSLVPQNRPVLGTTQQLRVDDIPIGSSFGAVTLGFAKITPAFDLGVIGAPGCYQHATLDVSFGIPVNNVFHNFQLPIPNQAILAGNHVYAQAAVAAPNTNQLGLLTSNGVDLVPDQN